MHVMYIVEIYRLGGITVALIIWVYVHTQRSPGKLYRVRWCVTVDQGHSMSLKFVSIESPCAISY